MEKQSPNFLQNSLINPYKSKDYYPQKAKGISFFAFIFSIFLYISIFYIFNLSPSKLFNNTKFWFFISNTLIIIILVDYGSFSSSKHNDLYQDYIIMRRQPNAPLFSSQYNPQIITNKTCIPEEEVEKFQEKSIVTHQSLPQEKILTVIPERTSIEIKTITNFDGYIIEGDHDNKKPLKKKFRRSKSVNDKRVTIDESKNVIRRAETKKYEPPSNLVEEENKNDEYKNMSTEELNRRVEEFIQRFNRQIRLQKDIY